MDRVFVVIPRGTPVDHAQLHRLLSEACEPHEVVEVTPGKKRARVEETEAPPAKKSKSLWLRVFTDGACTGNGTTGARAGIGVFFGKKDPRNISERLRGQQTNNRAELTAICRAIEAVGPDANVTVMSDSMLCINTVTKWMKGWKKRGWRKADGKPVKNVDLVKRADALVRAHRGQLNFEHVKAHCGIFGNEQADRLASEGAAME